MNYKAFYRKYRPTNFLQIVGQDYIVRILKNSIINNSFGHAYLFSGPKGTGKTSVAKIFAKTINCENNIAAEMCNQCPSCLIINDNNNEIDILEIDGASNNGVEEIRNIRNNINLLPMNLKYKVYIIDEVHMLTISAFNALLKTLEEPPKHIIFIFATTEPYKIPETIISRCQWFQFEKINQLDLIKVFSDILSSEKISFEQEALSEIALLSDGSLRDGINNLEKVFNFSNEISLASVTKINNIISIDKKLLLLKVILSHDSNQMMMILNEISSYISDFKKFLIDMLSLMQDIIIYKLTLNIKTSIYLNLKQIEVFLPVENTDLKLILNLFENVVTLNFDNLSLKTILIARLLKVFDSFKQYNLLENKLDFLKLNKEEAQNKPLVPKIDDNTIIDNSAIDEKVFANIINVIVQASKEDLKEVKKNWLKINDLIKSNKFRNFGKFYFNTLISAASINAIIIICDNIIQADLINKNFSYQDHRNFLNFVLTKEYMIYALDKKQWKIVGQKYKILKEKKQLPEPKTILISDIIERKITETKTETLSFLQNIFSKIDEK